ncbi:MarR family winged helix-turn-helix transcriptional regulator [Fulvimarina sp. MAC3]|uniref:MarR family winged helix-turn-helix transcriptional regulator n=1 Tax=Fulvimarina sp. MAC3 TaxID=3148887 RepID=UPI0031FC6A85
MLDRTPSAEMLTDLILSLFRVNNAALTWGDRLVLPHGLTSARWQIMGAIAYASEPQPVAWLARDLGANRQNVQRIVNELAKEGLVTFKANPRHKRAQLVVLTAEGQHAYDNAIRAWNPAADELARDLSPDDLATVLRVLTVLRGRLTASNESDAPKAPPA